MEPLAINGLILCEQQLGYKNQSGCTYTVTIMKTIVIQYNKVSNNIDCTMIDLSKAFDEITQIKFSKDNI